MLTAESKKTFFLAFQLFQYRKIDQKKVWEDDEQAGP